MVYGVMWNPKQKGSSKVIAMIITVGTQLLAIGVVVALMSCE